MSLTTKISHPSSFQFKASFSPCIIFEILRNDIDSIKLQLADTIQKTPNFFSGSPVVIDLEKSKSIGNINFAELKHILQTSGLIPVGIRNGTDEQQKTALAAGLPLVNIGKVSTTETTKKNHAPIFATKLVNQPIRSGMQVYAKNGDLIVTSQVSPGAELMADGHIHVYGALRGRALAGVQGNTHARIFCRSLEAELIAIAGCYLTREEIALMPITNSGMIQIYLHEEKLHIEPL